MFFLLTLPFRIAFGLLCGVLFLPFMLLLVPFLLLRVMIKAAVGLIVLPIALVLAFAGFLIACLAVSFAVLIPLLPIAFLVFCVWAVVKLTSRPAAVSH